MSGKCPSETASITSEFSVIPEMSNFDENEAVVIPMSASFFHSDVPSTSNSAYQQVKFESILVVNQGCALFVKFTGNDDFSPQSSDRLALYRTGFLTTKDFLCYKWIPIPLPSVPAVMCEDNNEDGLVKAVYEMQLEVESFGKEVDQFYQVCYLKKDGSIAGVSSPFQLDQCEGSLPENDVDSLAKNVLSLRVRELIKEKETLESQLKNSTPLADQENAVAELEQVKLDLAKKEMELTRAKKEIEELKEKMTLIVIQMNDLQKEIDTADEKVKVFNDRESVLSQDNQDLKVNLEAVKKELAISVQKQAVSEKIATDLSQQLQSSTVECQMMTAVNVKLAKKIKKLRKIIAMMEGTENSSEWLSNEDDTNSMALGAERKRSKSSMESSMMSSSSVSMMDSVCQSLHSKMEEITDKLNKQTEEVKVLKGAVFRGSDSDVSATTGDSGVTPRLNISEGGSPGKGLYENSFLPASCTAPVFLPQKLNNAIHAPQESTNPTHREDIPPHPRHGHGNNDNYEDNHVEHGHAHQGSRGPCQPSAPALPRALPEPLQPETTETARQAEILVGFAAVQDSSHPYPPVGYRQDQDGQVSSSRAHESDSEDYHSTGDASENHGDGVELKCPLCPMIFLSKNFGLLEEHINIHLDKLCPVCSLGFPKSASHEEFEKHVQSHFNEESEDDEENSENQGGSGPGPWNPNGSFRLLEID